MSPENVSGTVARSEQNPRDAQNPGRDACPYLIAADSRGAFGQELFIYCSACDCIDHGPAYCRTLCERELCPEGWVG